MDDDECEDGEVCDHGICVVVEPDCTTDEDCDDGFVCREGECVEGPECTVDGDCPEGEVCRSDGTCEKVVVPGGCTPSNCASGVCIEDKCVEATLEGGGCECGVVGAREMAGSAGSSGWVALFGVALSWLRRRRPVVDRAV
jgi:uncharacterized protein (TIGR03382 family)